MTLLYCFTHVTYHFITIVYSSDDILPTNSHKNFNTNAISVAIYPPFIETTTIGCVIEMLGNIIETLK